MYVCMCSQIHFHKCKSMYMYIYYVHFKIICIHERQRRHTFTMHTHTHLPLERRNDLRRVRTQGGTLFTSSEVFLSSSLSLSLVCFSLSLHFMNYEMCNFYVFLRVFHRSQCAWHLPSCSPSCSPSPSPLQKFHSLPHGVALESQLLLCPICELYAVLSMFPV